MRDNNMTRIRELTRALDEKEALLQTAYTEQQLFLDSFPDLHFKTDEKGRILTYKFGKLNPHLSTEPFLGKHFWDIVPTPASEIYRSAYTALQANEDLDSTTIIYPPPHFGDGPDLGDRFFEAVIQKVWNGRKFYMVFVREISRYMRLLRDLQNGKAELTTCPWSHEDKGCPVANYLTGGKAT